MGRDGYIYTLAYNRVLKTDTINNSHCSVGVHDAHMPGDAMLEIDGCIDWVPCKTVTDIP